MRECAYSYCNRLWHMWMIPLKSLLCSEVKLRSRSRAEERCGKRDWEKREGKLQSGCIYEKRTLKKICLSVKFCRQAVIIIWRVIFICLPKVKMLVNVSISILILVNETWVVFAISLWSILLPSNLSVCLYQFLHF